MKVVLFCGGMGMRMREYSESIPKPIVPHRLPAYPLAYIQKYYSSYGHKEFILCLGHRADVIKNYFRNYDECVSNDFVLDGGKVNLLASDIHDWKITFVDTGLKTNIGGRLKAVQKYVAGEEMFLANYADGLSDVPLPKVIEEFKGNSLAVASFVSVKPKASFHVMHADAKGRVKSIEHIVSTGARINGGFFVLRPEIFDFMQEGDELVEAPFHRLIAKERLFTYAHDGYWACMDTFKEQQELETLYGTGNAPWAVWNNH